MVQRFLKVCDWCSSPIKTQEINGYIQCLVMITRRYGPLRLILAPAEGFGLRPRRFLPFRKKESLLCCFYFWCPVVTLVTFSCNISIFERNKKNFKKIQKKSKNILNLKKIQKTKKGLKNLKNRKEK